MGRCGCESATECGCTMSGSDCIGVSGNGAVGDPHVPSILISGDADNAAECRDDGLYVEGRVLDFDKMTRTAGSLSTSSTSYVNLSTTIDITLSGVLVGDVIEVGASMLYDAQAVQAVMDVATIVAGSPINYISGAGSAGEGVSAWWGEGTATQTPSGGTVLYTLVAGDLSAGTVLLRLRWRTRTAASKTVFATSTIPFHWYAKNLGPLV